MEILAPAGSRESLERAQAAGADAVYLGYAAFSARAGAGNFDEEQLCLALRFAHLHHMRVYVTVNTLVKDGELDGVRGLLRLLSDLRVDGVLVQDTGILRMIRREFPSLRIHASTQMAIHNATGVRWCARNGMRRVVLARECSLEEIASCVRTGTEIEVFGHGAQCVSVSGECLFSSMVGERSGNRGRCAQPCRKLYSLDGKKGAWLSPRDVCLRDRLPDLSDAGIASLKIEGRLKRPEYVYVVTDSYRQALNQQASGSFHPADANEKDSLKQIFHRGGFMEGYAFGAEDAGVIQPRSVNHQGLEIGRVTECRGGLARIRLLRDLHDGDGLRLRPGQGEADLTYSGPQVPAGETALLRIRPGLRAEAGDPVFRLTDVLQLSRAMAAPLRTVSVDMTLRAFPGMPLLLQVTDGESSVGSEGDPVSAARSRATSADEMERQLRKTGGTDFSVKHVEVETEGAFVPLSSLNELRRRALSLLEEERIRRFEYPQEQSGQSAAADFAKEACTSDAIQNGASHSSCSSGSASFSLPENLITVRYPAQAEAVRGDGRMIIWYPEDFRPEALDRMMSSVQPGDWLRLPEVCEEATLQNLHEIIYRNQNRLGGILLGSLGQLGLSWPVPVAAGPGIPVMNRDAARFLAEQGCVFITASPELTGEELRTLRGPGENLPPVAAPVYGRTQLMLLHHCPARTAQGWNEGHRACSLCDREDGRSLRGKALEDERGYRFPLLRLRLPEGCLVRLMNCLPTDLTDKQLSSPRLWEMTQESPEESAALLQASDQGLPLPGKHTRGHWARPVL